MAGKELSPAGSGQSDDMLEIRRSRGHGSDRRRVKGPTNHGEGEDTKGSARHLEPTRGDVLVRHPVAEEVQNWPDDEGADTRPRERTAERTGGHVHRDDHAGKLDG